MGTCQSRQAVVHAGGCDADDPLFQTVRRLRRRPSEQSVTIIPEVGSNSFDDYPHQSPTKPYKLIQTSKLQQQPQRQPTKQEHLVDVESVTQTMKKNIFVHSLVIASEQGGNNGKAFQSKATLRIEKNQIVGGNEALPRFYSSPDATEATFETSGTTLDGQLSPQQKVGVTTLHVQNKILSATTPSHNQNDLSNTVESNSRHIFTSDVKSETLPDVSSPERDDTDEANTSTTSAPGDSVVTGPQPCESTILTPPILPTFLEIGRDMQLTILEENDPEAPSDEEGFNDLVFNKNGSCTHYHTTCNHSDSDDEMDCGSGIGDDELPPPPPPPPQTQDVPALSTVTRSPEPGILWLTKLSQKRQATRAKEEALRLIAPPKSLTQSTTTTGYTKDHSNQSAVAPQMVSHFQRLRLQAKLQHQQSKKKKKLTKLEDRLSDVQRYRQTWQDYQDIQDDIQFRSSMHVDADNCSVYSNASSFSLHDSTCWYFDFQAVDFAFEGKDDVRKSQSTLSLLSASSMEAQLRIYKQKRRLRRKQFEEQGNEAGKATPSTTRTPSHSLVGGISKKKVNHTPDDFDHQSYQSAPPDYGPFRRSGLQSTPGNIATTPIDQLIKETLAEHDLTNMEVAFSPAPYIDDAASNVSDLADDLSRSSSHVSSASHQYHKSFSRASYCGGGGSYASNDYGVSRRQHRQQCQQQHQAASVKLTALELKLQLLQNQHKESSNCSPEDYKKCGLDKKVFPFETKDHMRVVALASHADSATEDISKNDEPKTSSNFTTKPLVVYANSNYANCTMVALNSANPDLSTVMEESSPTTTASETSRSAVANQTVVAMSKPNTETPLLGNDFSTCEISLVDDDSLLLSSPQKLVTSLMTSFNKTVERPLSHVCTTKRALALPTEVSLMGVSTGNTGILQGTSTLSHSQIATKCKNSHVVKHGDATCAIGKTLRTECGLDDNIDIKDLASKKSMLITSSDMSTGIGTSENQKNMFKSNSLLKLDSQLPDPPGYIQDEPMDYYEHNSYSCDHSQSVASVASLVMTSHMGCNFLDHSLAERKCNGALFQTYQSLMQPDNSQDTNRNTEIIQETPAKQDTDSGVGSSHRADRYEAENPERSDFECLWANVSQISISQNSISPQQISPMIAIDPNAVVSQNSGFNTNYVAIHASPEKFHNIITQSTEVSTDLTTPKASPACQNNWSGCLTPLTPLPWIADLTTEQFLRLSNGNSLEKAARLERNELSDESDYEMSIIIPDEQSCEPVEVDDVERNFINSAVVQSIDSNRKELDDHSFEASISYQLSKNLGFTSTVAPVPISPDEAEISSPCKQSLSKSYDSSLGISLFESKLERRASLDCFRSGKTGNATEDGIILAEVVEAQIQDVLAKFRGTNDGREFYGDAADDDIPHDEHANAIIA